MSTLTALNRRARMESHIAGLDAENTRLHAELAASDVRERTWRLLAACLLAKLGGAAEIPHETQARMTEVIPHVTRIGDAGAVRCELPTVSAGVGAIRAALANVSDDEPAVAPV